MGYEFDQLYSYCMSLSDYKCKLKLTLFKKKNLNYNYSEKKIKKHYNCEHSSNLANVFQFLSVVSKKEKEKKEMKI